MIVRILGEGQFLMPNSSLATINILDSAVGDSLDGTDEAEFRSALLELLAKVREVGTPLENESLDSSDVILPFADASAEDVRNMLGDEGLVPG